MVYQVDVGYACAGVVMDGDTCIDAAPIFRWMVGKDRADIRRWMKSKRAKVKQA